MGLFSVAMLVSGRVNDKRSDKLYTSLEVYPIVLWGPTILVDRFAGDWKVMAETKKRLCAGQKSTHVPGTFTFVKILV